MDPLEEDREVDGTGFVTLLVADEEDGGDDGEVEREDEVG
jgi:hypothetical protein